MHAECVGENGADHPRNGFDVHRHDDDPDDEVEAGHDRHEVGGDVRDALGSTGEDRISADGDDQSGDRSKHEVGILDAE